MTKVRTYICMVVILALIILTAMFVYHTNYYNVELTDSATLI